MFSDFEFRTSLGTSILLNNNIIRELFFFFNVKLRVAGPGLGAKFFCSIQCSLSDNRFSFSILLKLHTV